MHAVGGIRWERAHVELLEYSEGDQRDDALAVGWYLVNGVPTVGAVDRPDPVGTMRGEVARAHYTAVRRRVGLKLRGPFSARERLAVSGGDRRQRGRVVGKPNQFAGFRCPTAGHECLSEPGLRLEQRNLRGPLLCDRRGDREAVAAIRDRRLEEPLERQLAELGV